MKVMTKEQMMQWCIRNQIMPSVKLNDEQEKMISVTGYTHNTTLGEDWHFYIPLAGPRCFDIYDSDILKCIYQQTADKSTE